MKQSQLFDGKGKIVADTIPTQDMIGLGRAGPDLRSHERAPRASDRGVILYHKMLVEQADRVERGEEPMALVRDPAENEPMINLGREQRGVAPAFRSGYDNYFEQLEELADLKGN